MSNLPSSSYNPFSPTANAEAIANGLEIIPKNWSLTPVQEKSPKRKNWQSEELIPHKEIARLILHGENKISKKGNPYTAYSSGFGLRLGNGQIAIDVDGNSAQPILEALSGGELPKTVSWTSGKLGRYQLLYQLPNDIREQLKNFNRSTLIEYQGIKTDTGDLLEFRYHNSQSVLPPSYHPTTGSYKWINSPIDAEVAIAPEWLCEYLLATHTTKKQNKIELKSEPTESQTLGSGNDLVSFVESEVLPELSIEQMFPGFTCYSQSGHDHLGEPGYRTSASKTSFSITLGNEPRWFDFKEGYGGDVIQYHHRLTGGFKYPTGKDYVTIVKDLASKAGLELPKLETKAKESKPEIKTVTIDDITTVIHPDQNPDYVYNTELRIDFKSSKPVDPKRLAKWVQSRTLTPNLVITSNEVDFGLFEQEDGAIYVIQAAMAGGKSVAARKNRVRREKEDNVFSVAVTARRKLVKQDIEELKKLGCNQVANFSEFDQSTLIPGNTHLIGCTESLKKIEGKAYQYDGYFDEFSTMIRQSVSGGTTKGSERAHQQEIVGSELRAYKRVYIMDDDASDLDVEMLKKLAPNKIVVVVKFETKPRLRAFEFLDGLAYSKDGEIDLKKANKSALFELLLRPNCTPFIVTDTQGNKIEKLFNGYGKVGFLINSEISANYPLPDGSYCQGETWDSLFKRIPEIKDRLQDLIPGLYASWVNECMLDPAAFIEKYKPDYFIGSPSIVAGFSVVLPNYFTCIAGVFCGLLRTQALTQILFRLRDNDISTYISISETGLKCEKDEYYDDDLGKLINERRSELAAEFNFAPVKEILDNAVKRINQTWYQRSSLEKGLESYEKNNYRSCLRFALEQKGHKINFKTSGVNNHLAANIKEIAIAENEKRASEIFQATEYPEGLEQAKEIHEKLETVATARSLTKAHFLERAPGIQNTEVWSENYVLECLVKNRQFIKQQETFHFIYNTDISKKKLEKALYNSVTSEFVDGDSLVHKDYHIIKALRDLGIPGLIKELENGLKISKKTPEVICIVAKARKDSKIHRLAGLTPGAKTVEGKENIKFISDILRLVGIGLESNGQNNTKDGKYHVYGLNLDKFKDPNRLATLECISKRWQLWLKEVYLLEQPDWEFTAQTGIKRNIATTLENYDVTAPLETIKYEWLSDRCKQLIKSFFSRIEPLFTVAGEEWERAAEILAALVDRNESPEPLL